MNSQHAGRILMTLILAGQSVLGFLLDWSPNHLLNPAWHPHARFHGALFLFLLAGVSASCGWLLWRESKEPRIALIVSSLVSLSFWTPFFFVTAILPGATLWAGDPRSVPHLGGATFFPNVAVAGLFILLIILSLFLGREGVSRAAETPADYRAFTS